MVWTHLACLSLKLWGQQLTNFGKKELELNKQFSLLFRGNEDEAIKD